MPAAADVSDLVRLLAHFGDHRIAGDGGEEAVDVDRRKALGKGDMLLRRQLLVVEKDHAILAEGAADLGECAVRQRRCEVEAANLSADIARNRIDPDVAVFHVILPAAGPFGLTSCGRGAPSRCFISVPPEVSETLQPRKRSLPESV